MQYHLKTLMTLLRKYTTLFAKLVSKTAQYTLFLHEVETFQKFETDEYF